MSRLVRPKKDSPLSQPEFRDELSGYIARGNVDMTRAYFDSVFWENKDERPSWEHLKLGLLREDKAMTKLLVTWGARATEEGLAELQRMDPKKYPTYLKLLRQSGHGMTAAKIAEGDKKAEAAKDQNDSLSTEIIRSFIDDKFVDHRINQIPREWRQALKAFHDTGAQEAIIAGGALRDTFNNRAVKDVDIFLQSRGSLKKNKKFLKQVFAASGLSVSHQPVYTGGYDDDLEQFPKPREGVLQPARRQGYGMIRPETKTESWVVIAGNGKTEYNIVFLNGPLGHTMSQAAQNNVTSAKAPISAFDLGMCQIAYDGDAIVTTEKYRHDVAKKLIELDQGNPSTLEHLSRIQKKYEDWTLGDGVKKMLKEEEERKKAKEKSRYTGYGSRRSSGYRFFSS